MHHQHHVYLVSVTCFLIGYALHVLVQVNDLAAKNKTSMLAVLKTRWVSILVRGFISFALFVGLMEGKIDDIVDATGIPIPDWMGKLLDVNVNQGWLAGLLGYAFDSALYYLPFLQKLGVPSDIDNAPAPPAQPAGTPAPAAPVKTNGGTK